MGVFFNTMKRFIIIVAFMIPLCSCNFRAEYETLDGFALGTIYHIVYEQPARKVTGKDVPQKPHINIPDMVEQTFKEINTSLSIYNQESIISKVNRNEPVALDSLFVTVFLCGKEVYSLTSGAFDMAAAPYFDLWGFGLKNREEVTQSKLDSIAEFVGMDKVSISDGKIVKTDPRISLSANAIAKGYCSDLIALRLQEAGINHFLVEVGGEIYCKGVSPQGRAWNIGIDRPEFGNLTPGRDMQTTLLISGQGLATSGNYRNYYEVDGQKYGHTVDPATGRPVQHSLLSATVIAPDCMSADAFATAFMVMGLEKTQRFLEAHPQMDAILIYSDHSGAFQSFATPNARSKMAKGGRLRR